MKSGLNDGFLAVESVRKGVRKMDDVMDNVSNGRLLSYVPHVKGGM